MTIGAADWVAGSSVDDAVVARWPSYAAVLVAVDHTDVASLASEAERLLSLAIADAAGHDPDRPDPHVEMWQQAYREFGVKPRVARPSVESLLRRAATLPRINTLVDLYNAISILHRVPIGGEDLDRYDGVARLSLATGDEPFHTTAHGAAVVEHPTPGEPVWLDGSGVTCRRWNWRQTTRTAITEHTTRVGFIIDSLDAPGHAGALRAAEHLVSILRAGSAAVPHASMVGNTSSTVRLDIHHRRES